MDVRRLVVAQGMALVGFAMLIGIGGALAVGRLLRGLLFGDSATDPVT